MVRGAKHPELEGDHGALAWRPLGTAVYDEGTVVGAIKMVDANSIARFDLGYIPAGTRLTTVKFTWKAVAGVAGQTTFKLRKRLLTSSAAPTDVQSDAVANNVGAGDKSLSKTYNITFDAGWTYWLDATINAFAAADIFLIGSSVKRDRL